MVTTITGSPKIKFAWKDLDSSSHSGLPSKPPQETADAATTTEAPIIDFSAPFQRISFVSKLKEILGDAFPDNFNSYGTA